MKIAILFDPGAEDWTPEDIRGVMKAVDEIEIGRASCRERV